MCDSVNPVLVLRCTPPHDSHSCSHLFKVHTSELQYRSTHHNAHSSKGPLHKDRAADPRGGPLIMTNSQTDLEQKALLHKWSVSSPRLTRKKVVVVGFKKGSSTFFLATSEESTFALSVPDVLMTAPGNPQTLGQHWSPASANLVPHMYPL